MCQLLTTTNDTSACRCCVLSYPAGRPLQCFRPLTVPCHRNGSGQQVRPGLFTSATRPPPNMCDAEQVDDRLAPRSPSCPPSTTCSSDFPTRRGNSSTTPPNVSASPPRNGSSSPSTSSPTPDPPPHQHPTLPRTPHDTGTEHSAEHPFFGVAPGNTIYRCRHTAKIHTFPYAPADKIAPLKIQTPGREKYYRPHSYRCCPQGCHRTRPGSKPRTRREHSRTDRRHLEPRNEHLRRGPT